MQELRFKLKLMMFCVNKIQQYEKPLLDKKYSKTLQQLLFLPYSTILFDEVRIPDRPDLALLSGVFVSTFTQQVFLNIRTCEMKITNLKCKATHVRFDIQHLQVIAKYYELQIAEKSFRYTREEDKSLPHRIVLDYATDELLVRVTAGQNSYSDGPATGSFRIAYTSMWTLEYSIFISLYKYMYSRVFYIY